MDREIEPLARPGRRSPLLLVGRAGEQLFLREELAAARGGEGRLVLLGGEAGIGKTTLAHDLAQAAEAAGVKVVAGHCFDLTHTAPYGPWLDLFARHQHAPDWPAPPAAFRAGRLGQVGDQAALFAEVRRFLTELAAPRPVYLLLEDLHWADPASLELLRHLTPILGTLPVLIVATYRLDELTRHHSLFHHLPALVREGYAARVEPRRLDPAALAALVAARYRLAESDAARLVSYLARHAEGNPFFAGELLRALEDEGLLRPGDTRSSLGELARVVVPPLLRQVIEGRIARLGETIRQPLMLAAVIGQEVELGLWAALAGCDEETLLTIVERVVDAHLMEARRDGTHVRFVHALTREALYESILPPRRRLWHRRVAEALLARADPDPDAVAFHLQEAGDPRAWEWLVASSDRAQLAYAWLTAADRLRAADALLAEVEGAAGTRGRLIFRRTHLQRFSDPSGAIAHLDDAERLAARAGNVLLAAESRHARGVFLCYTDRLREGLAVMLEGIAALEALPQDFANSTDSIWGWFAAAFAGTISPPTRDDELTGARLHQAGLDIRRCIPVWFGALAGQPGDAGTAGERFLAILGLEPGATEGVRFAAAFAYHGLGIAYAALGRPDDARQAWGRGRALFFDHGHHMLVAFARFVELWDVVYPFAATDPAVRRRYAAEAEAALGRAGGALAPGVSPRLAWLSCFVFDGHWAEALAILDDLPTPINNCLRREVTSRPAIVIWRVRGRDRDA